MKTTQIDERSFALKCYKSVEAIDSGLSLVYSEKFLQTTPWSTKAVILMPAALFDGDMMG